MKWLSPLIICLVISRTIAAIPLDDRQWLFQIGDDSLWSSPGESDTDWYHISVPNAWEAQGFPGYDGFAWYRLHFDIDTLDFQTDSVVLQLGRIADADQCFLNGSIIGQSGQFPPLFLSAADRQRRYRFPRELLESRNLIALRTYDHSGEGGILEGPIFIEAQRPPEPKDRIESLAHRSWDSIPFANGIVTANYDVPRREFNHFYPHIYQKSSAEMTTPVALKSARIALFRDNTRIPLTELKTQSIGYIPGTGIIKHTIGEENLKLTIYAFCPFTAEKPLWVIYGILEGDDLHRLSLNFLPTEVHQNVIVHRSSYREKNRRWIFACCLYTSGELEQQHRTLRKFKNEHPGFSLLLKEIEWWHQWQQETIFPEHITNLENELYAQSLALLKMAQSRENFPRRGQIIATLPPSPGNDTEVRRQSLALQALLQAGHTEEALAALQFIMNSRCGKYAQFPWKNENMGIGRDYAISAYRYYGNGVEYSEATSQGFFLRLDGFGLTLHNIRRYIEVTEDHKFLKYYWPKISRQIADVLIHSIDETGLIRADGGLAQPSEIPKHYAYTSACSYRGLRDAAWMARLVNDEENADRYESVARSLHKSITDRLVLKNPGVLLSNLEDGSDSANVDFSCLPALSWAFNSRDSVAHNTLRYLEGMLKHPHPQRGFRIAPFKTVALPESIYGNLQALVLYQKTGAGNRAAKLKHWVIEQAIQNYGLIPEYYQAKTADYFGRIPDCGLGAGAFILSYWGE